MEKIIRISNKDYKMKASALTQFSYKNETGRSFLKDLQKSSILSSSVLPNACGVIEKVFDTPSRQSS